jgi:hypothetical protein
MDLVTSYLWKTDLREQCCTLTYFAEQKCPFKFSKHYVLFHEQRQMAGGILSVLVVHFIMAVEVDNWSTEIPNFREKNNFMLI